MLYILADTNTAKRYGFSMLGRKYAYGRVILNQREVQSCSKLMGTLKERAEALCGDIKNHHELSEIINRKY